MTQKYSLDQGGGSGGILLGVKAAIIASGCCTIPLVLVFLFGLTGFGSITAALAIPKYKNFFIFAGTLFLILSVYLSIRRRCGGSCTISDVAKNRRLILISLITYVVLTAAIIYLLLPTLAEWLI